MGGYVNTYNRLELYARAVDIARVSDLINFLPTTSSSPIDCQEDTYYNIGEATWSGLQKNIKNWINENGGQAVVIEKVAIRFKKEKLKELLEGSQEITDINCN